MSAFTWFKCRKKCEGFTGTSVLPSRLQPLGLARESARCVLTGGPCARVSKEVRVSLPFHTNGSMFYTLCISPSSTYTSWDVFRLARKERHLFLRTLGRFPARSSSVSHRSRNPASPNRGHIGACTPRGCPPRTPPSRRTLRPKTRRDCCLAGIPRTCLGCRSADAPNSPGSVRWGPMVGPALPPELGGNCQRRKKCERLFSPSRTSVYLQGQKHVREIVEKTFKSLKPCHADVEDKRAA